DLAGEPASIFKTAHAIVLAAGSGLDCDPADQVLIVSCLVYSVLRPLAGALRTTPASRAQPAGDPITPAGPGAQEAPPRHAPRRRCPARRRPDHAGRGGRAGSGRFAGPAGTDRQRPGRSTTRAGGGGGTAFTRNSARAGVGAGASRDVVAGTPGPGSNLS